MVKNLSLAARSVKHIWHPCSQMKDYESFSPLEIVGAHGSHLKLKSGAKVIDAISSWWCKSLGHGHPRLKSALLTQVEKFEHVILANATNDTIVDLSEKLAGLSSSLPKVFYASEGSSAVEIAIKMSLQARKIRGQDHKYKFIALQNAYHGETTGALSVSDLGIYTDAYKPILFETYFISGLPYVTGTQDPLWDNCEFHWREIEKQLERHSVNATAILVEPIVQGAGGMKIYSQDFLHRLRAWTKAHDIYLIADEIMTGMGRTGKMLACEYANIEPDFLCLSKGLTAGWLPLSAVLTTQDVFDLFYDDYASGKSFLHSHTFGGNALAASVAIEVLNIFAEENICARAVEMGNVMREFMLDIAASTKKITNVRSLGGIVAADLISSDSKRRVGYEIYRQAIEMGALLRPLGNTIYWLPPLNTALETLVELKEITQRALCAVEF